MLKPTLSAAAWTMVSIKWDPWNCYIWNHSQIRESAKSPACACICEKEYFQRNSCVFFPLGWGWLQPESWYFRSFQLPSDVTEAEFHIIVSTKNEAFSVWEL